MSVTLELEPEVETSLRTFAAAEGTTPDAFIARLLAGYRPPADAAEPEWKAKWQIAQEYARQAFVGSGKTEEELGGEIDAKIKGYRAERRADTERS